MKYDFTDKKMTITEWSKVLDLSYPTVQRMVKRGDIPKESIIQDTRGVKKGMKSALKDFETPLKDLKKGSQYSMNDLRRKTGLSRYLISKAVKDNKIKKVKPTIYEIL